MKKIRYLVKVSKHDIIVYTNHFTIVKIFKQTFLKIISIDKLNLQLVQASQYIQNFYLQIFHKSEKMHLIFDIFSQLSNKAFSDDIKFINTLHENMKYTATMIELSEEFKKCLQDKYQKNLKLQKILDMIANNDKLSSENRTKLSYKSEKNLLYQIINNKNHLCISCDLIHEILKLTHNFIHHNFDRFLQNLIRLFIYKKVKFLKQFIDHCLQCKLNHSRQH